MSFFPNQVMPKTLKHETSHEVDGDPNIYNASDFNRHHRELIAIQRLLIGNNVIGTAASGVAGFSCSDFSTGLVCPGINFNPVADPNDPSNSPTSIQGAITTIGTLIDRLTNAGLFVNHTGTIATAGRIPLPPSVVSTTTPGGTLSSATSIPVASTAGFPQQGFITKFNRNSQIILCTPSGNVPVKGRCAAGNVQVHDMTVPISSPFHVTNQEIIAYTSITPTSFDGCTRSYAGTTAEDVIVLDQQFNTSGALIVSGRASIFFTHSFWTATQAGQGGGNATPSEILIENDALLDVIGYVYKDGTPSLQEPASTFVEIGYSLCVIGQFDNIDLTAIYNLLEL